MDYTNTEFWIAIGVGGAVIAAASAAQQLMNKNPSEPYSEFRIRPVIRDFCLGAFLSAIIYMFLPESVHTWISGAQNAVSSVSSSMKAKPSVSFGGAQDIELQIGPARF